MQRSLDRFEEVVRRARNFTDAPSEPTGGLHAFEQRNVHPGLPAIVRDLFDDGHFAQATFEAFKFLDKEVQQHSGSTESGFKLMMQVFSESAPTVQLTPVGTVSEKDEQKGFQFLFAGSVLAIRNPRGHEFGVRDTPDQCLDHLGLASLLLRRLEDAGFKCSAP
jgi:uncharacterized protein (TIGR02391 family)